MYKWLFVFLVFTSSISFTTQVNAMQCIDEDREISIRYLGVGALDIHFKGQRILTDPFYSPQSIWKIITFDKYRSNPESINKALGPYQKNVDAVLVGHGHYDHLADLPAIKNFLKDDAIIVGSTTSNNMITPSYDQKNLLSISEKNANQWHYIANGWIRIKAQLSEHAPQFMNYNLAKGEVNKPRKKLPRYIWSWSQGKNLSYIIDFLSEKKSEKVYKRIFMQTSASNFPVGYQPITDNNEVDVMFVAAASFDNVENYPYGLLRNYKPQETFLIHWENFLTPWMDAPSKLGTIDFDKLIKNSNKAHSGAITVPNPHDCIYL